MIAALETLRRLIVFDGRTETSADSSPPSTFVAGELRVLDACPPPDV